VLEAAGLLPRQTAAAVPAAARLDKKG